jgi:DNA-binding transcriptional LysR family regulator
MERTFVLLTADVVAGTFLPGLLRRLSERAPNVQLRLLQISEAAEGVAPSLWEGMADLHVGPPLGLSEGLVRRRLLEMGHVVLSRPGHPEIEGPFDLDTYCRLRHILVTSRFPTRSWVDEGLSELGRRREVALALPYFAAAALMVGQSDLICTMPELPGRSFARQMGLCLHRPPLEAPRLSIFLHWEERLSQDPAHAWLRQQVAEASAELVEAALLGAAPATPTSPN